MSGPTIVRPDTNSYTTVDGPLTIGFFPYDRDDKRPVETWIKPEFIPREGDLIKLAAKWWTVMAPASVESPVRINIIIDPYQKPRG